MPAAALQLYLKCKNVLYIFFYSFEETQSTVSPMLNRKKLRNMILMARQNGAGHPYKNCWILFYRCPRLKI